MGLQGRGRRQVRRQHAGLGVVGEVQLLLGAVKAQRGNAAPQGHIRHVEYLPGGGLGLAQVLHHAGELGPLAGKQKRDLHTALLLTGTVLMLKQ